MSDKSAISSIAIIDEIERVEILRDYEQQISNILVDQLLREVSTFPKVCWCCLLDSDKEGFGRSRIFDPNRR